MRGLRVTECGGRGLPGRARISWACGPGGEGPGDRGLRKSAVAWVSCVCGLGGAGFGGGKPLRGLGVTDSRGLWGSPGGAESGGLLRGERGRGQSHEQRR